MDLFRSFLFARNPNAVPRANSTANSANAVRGVELMEPRLLLAADTLYVGAVYVEQDDGSDEHGDRFELSFVGGADGTQLTRVTIDGDQDAPGFAVGDVFFDSKVSSENDVGAARFGADEAQGFKDVSSVGIDKATPVFSDGGTLLAIDFEGFDAGERFVFTIDVDEVQDYDPTESDFELINEGFDPITSGVEFQGSILTASFTAAHYEDAIGEFEFRNVYDRLLDGTGLNLPPDNDQGLKDRSAGTAGELQQEIIPAQISGHVYHDENQNGRMDDWEQGIPNVDLTVVPLETVIAQEPVSVTTDDDGFYDAVGLSPGTYQIVETQPVGYIDGIDVAGTVDSVGSGAAMNPGDLIDGIFLAGGAAGVDYDFGEILAASLEGSVHLSTPDGDCFSDDIFHEPVAGATIQLFAADGRLVGETETDESGSYRFENLAPGEYTVVEITPDGLLDGGADRGEVRGELRGVVESANRISSITLGSGEDGIEYDFCDVEPVDISGTVHIGTPDGDCFDDTLEHQPLPGVRIELLDSNGQRIAETLTNERGEYAFLDLPPGTYSIVEHTPNELLEGGAQVDDIDGAPGGIVENSNLVSNIVLGSGQSANVEFCEFEPAIISGFVYHDRDNDGVFGDAEDPIEAVLVELYSNGNPIDAVLTDAGGSYAFEDLPMGIYTIVETQPIGWLDGKDTVGSLGGNAVEPDSMQNVSVLYGDRGVEYNFGELQHSTLSGNVHLGTTDGDCFSENEFHAPLEGVIVELLDVNGSIIATTATNSSGDYTFENLTPGTYGVRELTPEQYLDGGAQVGEVDGVRSGIATNASEIRSIEILSGTAAIDYDFCEFEPSNISGFVYHDENGDGNRENTEDPIPATRIALYDDNGNEIAETTTDENGFYEFSGLPKGNYRLREIQPDGWIDGTDAAGTIDGVLIGIADNPGDAIHDIAIGFGQTGIEYNFGELLPGSITGSVHAEYGIPDCVFDAEDGDIALADVTVQLLDNVGNILAETKTNDRGEYAFVDLPPGEYALREIQPDDYFDGQSRLGQGAPDAEQPNDFVQIFVGSGEHLDGFVFCEDPPVEISGYVFQDGPTIDLGFGGALPDDIATIRDGEFTPDDTPLAGVRVELRSGPNAEQFNSEDALPNRYPAGRVFAVTDENGFYKFDGLRSATYAVYEYQPDGFIDGLDTGGIVVDDIESELRQTATTRAIPINQNDPQADLIKQNLVDAPGFDAITFIQFGFGSQSVQNNFSEIVVRKTPIIPGPPPPLPTPVLPAAGISAIESLRSPYQPLELGDYTIESAGRVRGRGNTWHLSVIDGGTPRGEGQKISAISPVWQRSSSSNAYLTSLNDSQIFEWTLIFSEDDVRKYRFGSKEGIPVVGDWDGDGLDDFGIYAKGHWLIDVNGNRRWDDADLWAKLGYKNDQPVTGDWDADGKSDIGIFGPAWPGDPIAVFLEPGLPDRQNAPTGETKNLPPKPDDTSQVRRMLQLTAQGEPRSDVIDHVFHYGGVGDRAIAGDWNGDGVASVGVFRNGHWILDRDGNGRFSEIDMHAEFGERGDIPVVGDFDGDGIDEIGIYRHGKFYLDTNGNRELDSNEKLNPIEVDEGGYPIVGDWDGDGKDNVGTVRTSQLRFVEIEARIP